MCNIVFLVVYLLFVPLMIGYLFCSKEKKEEHVKLIFSYVSGNIILWALFWLLCVPIAMLRLKFSLLVWIFNITILLLMVLSFKKNRTALAKSIKSNGLKLTRLNSMDCFILLCILAQTIVSVTFATYIGADDATYIATSLDAVVNNSIATVRPDSGLPGAVSLKLILTSWNYYISYLSYISGVHVAAIAHTILPFTLTPMAYMGYSLLGYQIFNRDRKKTELFLFFMNLFVIFGCYSWYTASLRLTICIWHGKAVMAVVVLPFLFYYLMDHREYHIKETIFIITIMIAACSMSLMGVGLSVLLLILFLCAGYKKGCLKKYRLLLLAGVLVFCIALFYLQKLSYWNFFTFEKIKELYPRALTMAQDVFAIYWNKSPTILIYLASMLYLFVNRKKNEFFYFIVRYTLIFYIFLYNPVIYYVAYIFCHGASVYVRLLYIIFPEVCMAVALSFLVDCFSQRSKRIVSIIMAAICIALFGQNYIKTAQFQKAENIYKLPQEIITLCDLINENATETPYLMADQNLVNYIRQYSSKITMLYGRGGMTYKGKDLFTLIQNSEISIEEIVSIMERYDCNYIIWKNHKNEIAMFLEYGTTIVASTEHYTILKR